MEVLKGGDTLWGYPIFYQHYIYGSLFTLIISLSIDCKISLNPYFSNNGLITFRSFSNSLSFLKFGAFESLV